MEPEENDEEDFEEHMRDIILDGKYIDTSITDFLSVKVKPPVNSTIVILGLK